MTTSLSRQMRGRSSGGISGSWSGPTLFAPDPFGSPVPGSLARALPTWNRRHGSGSGHRVVKGVEKPGGLLDVGCVGGALDDVQRPAGGGPGVLGDG